MHSNCIIMSSLIGTGSCCMSKGRMYQVCTRASIFDVLLHLKNLILYTLIMSYILCLLADNLRISNCSNGLQFKIKAPVLVETTMTQGKPIPFCHFFTSFLVDYLSSLTLSTAQTSSHNNSIDCWLTSSVTRRIFSYFFLC